MLLLGLIQHLGRVGKRLPQGWVKDLFLDLGVDRKLVAYPPGDGGPVVIGIVDVVVGRRRGVRARRGSGDVSQPRVLHKQVLDRQMVGIEQFTGVVFRTVKHGGSSQKTTVGAIVSMARVAGVDWALAQTLNDEELEARVYRPAVPRSSRHLEPDFALIHQELRRPGVTLQLLWEEYQRDNALAYKYTAFCVKYRAWAAGLKRSMRQTHIAGEKLFVDYAGQTMPIVDAASGEIRRAQIFVAVLGASNYTYACATATQTAADWVGSIIDALEFIGGVPRLIVPDQPRALIARPDRYDPIPGRLVEEFSAHYGVAVLPARPAHPRDKPKVEVGVQVVERWILARLRHRRFFSLGELNAAIGELLTDLNHRPFKKLPGCRHSAFLALDRSELRPLPAHRMPIARFKRARVNIDYHVELDGHYYSVPHRLVRQEVPASAQRTEHDSPSALPSADTHPRRRTTWAHPSQR